MPWYHGDYPPSYKNQPVRIREKAVEIANTLLKEGADEGIAIATGLKRAANGLKNRMNPMQTTNQEPEQIHLEDDGTFPNSPLPALLYKGVLDIPLLFPAKHVTDLFESHNWSNSWDDGIFEYHHYHSVTHEVLGIYSGETTLQLGGEHGEKIKIQKGDILVIPAGVAHKNLGKENDIGCIGAYPDGKDYDMNYGKPGERPGTDHNIQHVPLPKTDPVYGEGGLMNIWDEQHRHVL